MKYLVKVEGTFETIKTVEAKTAADAFNTARKIVISETPKGYELNIDSVSTCQQEE